jgi:menaquinone-specific isochorismate synthase
MTIPAIPDKLASKPSHVGEFVRAALGQLADADSIAVVSVPAPVVPVETLLEAAPHEDAILWDPPHGPAFAALGAVETLRGEGASRIAQIRDRAQALSSNIRVLGGMGDGAPEPRFFGGFAFQPGAARAEPWSHFGEACFVLPRVRYARHGDRAWLTVAARGAELRSDGLHGLVSTTEALWSSLRGAATRPPMSRRSAAPRVTAREETTEDEWKQLVQSIVDRIGHGDFEKIVIARRSTLSFDRPIDVLDVLSELTSSPNCTRFAFRFARATFLGASPERLLRRAGLDIETEALAGTNRIGDAGEAAEMLESPKEREEHDLVVREIVSSLASVCAVLHHPRSPEVRVLRHLLHLTTPIRGRLNHPLHVLDLVERLHPTPAVGGVPTRDAVQFIATHETMERGWYASPIGWFDVEGDGEFAVALRSGAFMGNRAYLYAGGGIVRDSNPASEYAETQLKLQTLCAALHVAQ